MVFCLSLTLRALQVERDPVRLVRKCRLVRTEEGFRIEVEGSGFLYKQVRNMVGAILRIGRGAFEGVERA